MAARPAAAVIAAVLAQLDEDRAAGELRVGPTVVPVTNLGRELWPRAGRRKAVTKRDLLRYFARVSPWLLPHLADRPIFVSRFPGGIGGQTFFQKHWDTRPPFARMVSIYSSHTQGDGEYLLCDSLPTLLWLGQMAALELHAWFSRVRGGRDTRGRGRVFTGSEEALDRSVLNYPDFIVFDLDPYLYAGTERPGEEPARNAKAYRKTRDLAFHLRDVLDQLGLTAFPKLSGRTGIHIFLPIRRNLDFDATRQVAQDVGRHFVGRFPDRVTMEWATRARRGKIFFDANQNSRGKSLASVFSPRRDPAATVSMPVTWERLREAEPTDFTLETVPPLLDAEGDPWAGILDAAQDLPTILRKLSAGPPAAPAAPTRPPRARPARAARKAPRAASRRAATPGGSLGTYQEMRDFAATPEPRGRKPGAGRRRPGGPRFVVQKHEASRLHYDFRLEIGGVLKSWAVPKGPSLDPGVKRLAVETEDHPLEYGGFEGVIPAGHYGAGTVMVWDAGSFRLAEGESAEAAYQAGRLKVELEGKKLNGAFHLVRTARGERQWLLMKSRDRFAAKRDVVGEDRSAKSGRTMAAIRAAG